MEDNFERTIRLSKAAKILNVGKDTIVEFLTARGFTIDPSPNTKLTAAMYALLAKEYQVDAEVAQCLASPKVLSYIDLEPKKSDNSETEDFSRKFHRVSFLMLQMVP